MVSRSPAGRALGAVTLFLPLLLAGCGARQAPPPALPEAGIVVVQSSTVALTTVLAGRTTSFMTSEVRPQVSGIVRARLFTEGAPVHAGQTLYEIDPALYRAALDQARANLANTQAAAVSARALVERYKPLVGIEAVSKQDYTNAVAAAGQANAAVAQAKAALETARINLGYTRIAAPISGRIGRSLVTPGALVTAGQADALATIQQLDPIYVDIQQSSAELLRLRQALATGGVLPASAAVSLTLEDGTPYAYKGRLEFAEVTVDPATGSVTLRARFPNPKGLLLPGMYVRASLSQGNRPNSILAPQTGVTRDAKGNATALVVGAGDKVALRELTLGGARGHDWLVLQGLKAGDRLIVEGTSKVKPGDKVKPVPAGTPTILGAPGAGAEGAGAARGKPAGG